MKATFLFAQVNRKEHKKVKENKIKITNKKKTNKQTQSLPQQNSYNVDYVLFAQSLVSYDFVGLAVWIVTTVTSVWDSKLPSRSSSSFLEGFSVGSSSSLRAKLTTPLSFMAVVMDGISILPV